MRGKTQRYSLPGRAVPPYSEYIREHWPGSAYQATVMHAYQFFGGVTNWYIGITSNIGLSTFKR